MARPTDDRLRALGLRPDAPESVIEARMAALEARIAELEERQRGNEREVAELRGMVEAMPSARALLACAAFVGLLAALLPLFAR